MKRIPFQLSTVLISCLLTTAVTAVGFAQEGRWLAHDMSRPRPAVVTPAKLPLPVSPPEGAVILFDGSDFSKWQTVEGGEPAWNLRDGYMETVPEVGSIVTRQVFGDIQLHLEWSSPNPAHGTGQDRGNSGVYLMGMYEVQVLDSYQSQTYADGQAAAIYGQYPPSFNASRPPGEWQSYDILFRAPRFDNSGKLLSPARVTVLHNGVLVQNNVEFWGPSRWLQNHPYKTHPEKLPLALQDHDSPVRFRNIWLLEIPEMAPGPSRPTANTAVTLSPQELDRYAGRYNILDEDNDFEIRRQGSKLYLHVPGPPTIELVPTSAEELSLKWTASKLVFTFDDSGKASGFTFHIGGDTRIGERIQ